MDFSEFACFDHFIPFPREYKMTKRKNRQNAEEVLQLEPDPDPDPSKRRPKKQKPPKKAKDGSDATSNTTSLSRFILSKGVKRQRKWAPAEEEDIELNPNYPDLNPRKLHLIGPGKPPYTKVPPNFNGDNVVDSFRALRLFMIILLRFPFSIRRAEIDEKELKKKKSKRDKDLENAGGDQYQQYDKIQSEIEKEKGKSKENVEPGKIFYFGFSFASIGFLSTLFIFTLIFVLILGNALSLVHDVQGMPEFYKNKNFQDLRSTEMFIVHRNYLSLGILCCNLIQILISDFYLLFFNRGVKDHLNEFVKVAEELNLDMGKNLYHRSRLWIFGWIGILCIFGLVWIINFSPLVTGGPAALVVLIGRIFFRPMTILDEFKYIRGFLIPIFLYTFVASKLYVFPYFYLCNAYENAFEQLNDRLVFGLHGVGQFYTDKDKEKYRISLELLYDDFNVLNNLFSSVNDSYGLPIDTVTGILQLYFMARAFTPTEEFRYARTLDGYIAFMLFTHDMILFFLILTVAESVENYGRLGYELISSKGLIGHRSTKEILFMAGFFLGFSMTDFDDVHFAGSDLLQYDEAFAITTFIDIVSHFLLLFTFNLRFTLTGDLQGSANDKQVINTLEDTRQIFPALKVGY